MFLRGEGGEVDLGNARKWLHKAATRGHRAATKTLEDIEKLAELQRKLLEHAATLVRTGGRLVFANCSIDPLEGEEVVRAVLAGEHGLELSPIAPSELPGAAHFITTEGYLRTLPAIAPAHVDELQAVDGFFAARFIKR